MIISDELHDLLTLESVDNARKKRKDFSFYKYDDEINVPRVTKILDAVNGNKDYLIKYACGFGSYYDYIKERDIILDVGSATHECIEFFLENREDPPMEYKKSINYMVYRAYTNFKAWFNNLIETGNSFELIGLEVPVITPWYAGTLDCLCKINGAIYILDFKTSKQISSENIMQACCYKAAVDAGYCNLINHVDGVGIIRVDKYDTKYDDLFLNEFNTYQNSIIQYNIQAFMSILTTFYHKINIEYQFNQYKKQYPGLTKVINNLIEGE